MDIKKRYLWSKNPETGRFNIYNVEVFENYKHKDRGEVGEKEAREIIKTFRFNRDKRGHYPRVHIGHHDSAENKEGAGWMDNLRYANGQFLADFVEIYPEKFAEIKRGKYPYRSVEYDPDPKEIASVALLESHAPFFKFPMLFLAEEKRFQASNYTRQRFQLLCFQEASMDEKYPGEQPPEDKEMYCDKPDGKKDMEYMQEGEVAEGTDEEVLGDPFENINSKLDQLISLLSGQGAPQSAPMAPQNPAPVAMQQSNVEMLKYMKNMNERLDRMERKTENDVHLSRLRNMCQVNPVINFQEHADIVRKFPDTESRKLYLDAIEAQCKKFDMHPATQFAQKFSGKTQEDVSSKYKGDESIIARHAYRDWCDTVGHLEKTNSEGLKKFQSRFATPEDYADVMVRQCERDFTTRNEFLNRRN
jgi:hypothetical protein